jgi:hypothetical protein
MSDPVDSVRGKAGRAPQAAKKRAPRAGRSCRLIEYVWVGGAVSWGIDGDYYCVFVIYVT